MHVALDASNLAKKAPTGVAVYGIRLIDHIAALDRENRYTLCYRLSRWKDRRYFHRVHQHNFRTKIIQEPLNLFFTKRVDLFHGLDARMYDSPRVKNVVTIHDLPQHSNLYSGTRHPERKFRLYADIMARADRIIADSAYTKADILRFYSIPEERIDVVPLGVDVPARSIGGEEVRAVRARYGIPTPYLLHVGRIETKKNLRRSLEAFAEVRKQSAEVVQFVLAGTPGPGAEEVFRTIERFNLSEAVHLAGYVSQEDLPALYSGALAFLFPSLYEGFGMPVLEAMACGTPVLTSNVTSLPEVAGDAALLVDPLDVDSIVRGMLRLLEEPRLRDAYVRKGLERVKEFTWERTARETLAVYRKTLGLA
jgi:glycosyltransferase involved in cell wall biosynthesis